MPEPFPKEFRRDVIPVARQGDQSIAQVVRSFGVSESSLVRWLEIAAREDGLSGGASSTIAAGGGGDLEAPTPDLVAHAEDDRVEHNTVHPHEALAWSRPSTSVWAWPTR